MEGVVNLVREVKRYVVMAALVLSALTMFDSAARAALTGPLSWEEMDQQNINLGQDSRNMQWWLVKHGTLNGAHFAVVREYYTSEAVRQSRITDLLTSGVHPDLAGALHYTEHGYEFSQDGAQFVHAYMAHSTQNAGAPHIRVSHPERAWRNVADSFAAAKAAEYLF